MDFRGSKQWDYRTRPGQYRHFHTDNGQNIDEVKRRALTALRSFTEGNALSLAEIEAPLWALVDCTHGNERVKGACVWFRLAASYDDEETRLTCCREAYGWIERALRIFL